jgi:hypothetical protein
VLVWDDLNTHVSRAMRDLVAARDWLTVYQLPAYAVEVGARSLTGAGLCCLDQVQPPPPAVAVGS